jgi:hypothetical protein
VRSEDGTHEEARNLNDYMTLLDQASVKHGRPVNIAKSVREWMIEAGFDSVTDDIYKVIYYTWGRCAALLT